MDWVHLHLALNHIPVVGIPFALIVVLCGWLRPRREVVMTGLWLLAITCALGIAIKFTGDAAAEALQKTSDALVQRHEQAADQATTGVFVLLLASAAAIIFARRGRSVPKVALVIVLLAGLVTCGLLARTANNGGQITHPEIR